MATRKLWCSLAALALAAAMQSAVAEIRIGQSAGLTGGQAEYSKDVRTGILAYFEAVNRAGGIHGQPLKLIAEDDKGARAQVLANTKKLIEQEKVFALIGYTSGAGVEGVLPMIDEMRVPMLSPATGNAAIRLSTHKYLFHTRAGYADEMRRMVDTLAAIGLKRIALVYLSDTTVNLKVMEDALGANNLKAVIKVGLDRNSKEFGKEIGALLVAEPQAVLFITNDRPVVEIVRGMRRKGYTGEFATSSFSGTSFVNDLKDDAVGVKVIQVLPSPQKTSLKLVREFQEHLKLVDANMKPNYTNFEGYVAARVLAEGLRRAGKNPTRERFVAALEGLREHDLGGYFISYTADSHGGSRYVDIGVFTPRKVLVF
jgi:ABC-type branched-subunit amino acid transport system substrate-binding protein